MKKFLGLFGCVILTGVLFAQQTEVRNVGSFSGIKASEGIDVYLKKGEKENLKIEVNGTDTKDVITEVSGGILKISMRNDHYHQNAAKVYVTYVSLDKILASSAANIYSDGVLKADVLQISVSSAGSVELQVEAGRMEVGASSAGDVELDGKAKSIIVDVSSAGQVDAYDLEVATAKAEANSAGSVKLFVTTDLDADASSGGHIRYRGSPIRTMTNSTSGGSVKKTN